MPHNNKPPSKFRINTNYLLVPEDEVDIYADIPTISVSRSARRCDLYLNADNMGLTCLQDHILEVRALWATLCVDASRSCHLPVFP